MAGKQSEFRYVEWDFAGYLSSETRARCIARGSSPLVGIAARGAYLELLNHCYNGAGTLPKDHQAMADLLALPLDVFETLWPMFADKFRRHKKDAERITNDIVETRLRSFKNKLKQKKIAGKSSYAKKVAAKAKAYNNLDNDRCGSFQLGAQRSTEERRGEERNTEEKSAEEPPKTVVQAPPPQDLFSLYLEIFLRAGVAMNERDKEKALRLWLDFENDEHQLIVADAIQRLKSGFWRNMIPLPANHLSSQAWRRTAQPRTIPIVQQKSAAENSSDEAKRRFRESR